MVPRAPFDLNASSAPVYCTEGKADIPDYRIHSLAYYVRFHCRDNPVKGDRPQPPLARRHSTNRQRLPHPQFSASGVQPMVLSRALILAAVTLLAGCCAIGQVEAQENLDAGKSPSQIFSGTCTACHKSARGLLKTVAPGSLQGFLRQHYTTSPQMAGVLASYLMSNGATDTRYGDKQKGARDGKEGRDAKSEARPVASPDTGAAQGETDRAGRNRRLAHPAEAPEAAKPAAEGQVPQAVSEQGPEGRKGKRLSKRGKP